MLSNTGIAVGLKKGFPTTKREKRVKPSHRRGHLNKRVKFVRDIIREVPSIPVDSPWKNSLKRFSVVVCNPSGCWLRPV